MNHCTDTRLDDEARFCSTGPPTGGHIDVAGDRRKPWVFHANSNRSAGNVAANAAAERALAHRLCVTVFA